MGESIEDALLEDDLVSGTFRWANAAFLKRTGYHLDKLSRLTAFDVMPARYHAALKNRLGGKRGKYFVSPIVAEDSRVTWWFSHDVEESYPLHWARGRYLTTTDQEGSEFELMALIADVANVTGEHLYDHESVHDWVRGEIARLDTNDSDIRKDLTRLTQELVALRTQTAQSTSAARDAANAALRSEASVTRLTDMHKNLETRVSTEILRLIGTDQIYENQLNDFKSQLSTAAQRATNSIQAAAKDAGKTISFKVSFPVGVLGGLAVIINHLLAHPEILAKLFRLE